MAERETWTIDELARRTGLTARNIRAYQTRGLLPPPQIRGRTGHYGPEHAARLRSVRELQAAGFNLEAIKRLLEVVPGEATEEALRFGRALLFPWLTEEPEVIESADLPAFGVVDAAAITRAAELGVIEPLEDGRFRVKSPILLRAGEQVAALGVSLPDALDVLEAVSRDADSVARTFVRLFKEHVWEPFERAGRPEAEWERVRQSVEQLSPLASTVLLTAFRHRMAEEIQAAIGDQLGGDGQETG